MSKIRPSTIPAEFPYLPFSEKLMLWAIRLWVLETREADKDQEALRHGFKLAGVPDAFFALDDFLCVISASATAQIDVGCPSCTKVSDDEHLLLGVISAWQQGHGKDQGTALLSSWLPLAAIRIIQDPASTLAHVLKCSGLIIRPRCGRPLEARGDVKASTMQVHSRLIH